MSDPQPATDRVDLEQSDRRELEELRAELATANRKLADAHKMASLGRLAAGIVHEINTPIGSIFSNNEVIIRSLDKVKAMLTIPQTESTVAPAKALAALDIIAGLAAVDKIACERISAIIRSLKTFARVNESDLRKVNINEILLNTLKLSGSVFRGRILIETDYADLPEVECYPALLNQVFLNLVVNAGQAIKSEGKIIVKSSREENWVHVSVADSGEGIPLDVQPKIFAAGFTTKPLGEGTGLGLTISREIVEDTHGGSISFESVVGAGTTFHVRIPIHQTRKGS